MDTQAITQRHCRPIKQHGHPGNNPRALSTHKTTWTPRQQPKGIVDRYHNMDTQATTQGLCRPIKQHGHPGNKTRALSTDITTWTPGNNTRALSTHKTTWTPRQQHKGFVDRYHNMDTCRQQHEGFVDRYHNMDTQATTQGHCRPITQHGHPGNNTRVLSTHTTTWTPRQQPKAFSWDYS